MSRYDTDYVLMMVNQRRKELIKEEDQARLYSKPPGSNSLVSAGHLGQPTGWVLSW